MGLEGNKKIIRIAFQPCPPAIVNFHIRTWKLESFFWFVPERLFGVVNDVEGTEEHLIGFVF